MVWSKCEWKVTTTIETSTRGLSIEQQQTDKTVEEYKEIFTSPTRVHVHYHVKNSIDMKPSAPFPNDHVYMSSLMENEESKWKI
jgi:hypothetical protein